MTEGAFAPKKKKLCIGEFSGGDDTANAACTLKTGGRSGGGGKLCIGDFSGGDETANAPATLKTGGSAGGGGGNTGS